MFKRSCAFIFAGVLLAACISGSILAAANQSGSAKRGVTRADTYLLEEADPGAKQLSKVPRGSKVAVTLYKSGYYYVSFGGQNGYIAESDLQVRQSAEQFKGKGEINAEDVKMRAKGDVTSAIVTVLSKKTQVEITEKLGNWYKVDDSRRQGYVHSDYLDIFEVDKAECCIELKMGMSGNLVQQLQTKLKEKGYFGGECNGIFGARTREAVKRFQRANSLQESGIADADTQQLLFAD